MMNNPIFHYAESYRSMARISVNKGESQTVNMYSVAMDIERNMAPLFEKEHKLRLEAERQVGELREQLANTESNVETIAEHNIELQLKLDTAMGLLRKVSMLASSAAVGLREYDCMTYSVWDCHLDDSLGGIDLIKNDIDDFLNTTSTEGKDHE